MSSGSRHRTDKSTDFDGLDAQPYDEGPTRKRTTLEVLLKLNSTSSNPTWRPNENPEAWLVTIARFNLTDSCYDNIIFFIAIQTFVGVKYWTGTWNIPIKQSVKFQWECCTNFQIFCYEDKE